MSISTQYKNLFRGLKLSSPRTTKPSNDLFSSAKNFLTGMRKDLTIRKEELSGSLSTEEVQKASELGEKSAGRRPSIHIETGLLERIKQAGYGNLVHQFQQPKAEEFDEQLDKAEQLMQDDIKFSGSDRKLIAAAVRVFENCKFPKTKFTPKSVQHAADNQINKSSSASFPTYRRKGEVIQYLIDEATNVFKGFGNPWTFPITRGFRLQIRQSPTSELNLKIRVMYPYPGVIILIEDTFIIPFVEHFISTDTFYVIGRSGREIGKLLNKCFNHKDIKRITSSDISAFDQNALNDNIIMAFWILRQQMSLTSQEHKIFCSICLYFCCSYAISKSKNSKARIFVKYKGVPSGSGFTNMIDSLINAIAFEYTVPGILYTGRVLICGDDNIFDSTNIVFEYYCEIFKNVFNWTIDVNKTKHFKDFRKLHFLGFDWINLERIQNPKLLINQCLWHTTFFKELDVYERELARASSVLLNAKNGSNIFKRVFPDVIRHLKSGYDVRFLYLFGSAPPTSLPGVVAYSKSKRNLKIVGHEQSLSIHLKDGWNIR